MFSKRAGHNSLTVDYNISDHSFYTFCPAPLCDMGNLKTDDDMVSLLAEAQRQLGLLEGSYKHIANAENIICLLKLKEAVMSCKIDDETRISDLDLLGLTNSKRHTERFAFAHNCKAALDYGVEKVSRANLTNKLIYETHGILMKHRGANEIVGAVRTKQILMDDILVGVVGMEAYNPTAPNDIKPCMDDIQEYIKRKDAINPLIKVALLHYQLEAIHPFESGNGKIGRILVHLYLRHTSTLKYGFLPLSEILETHKVEYFDRIKAIIYHGHYEQWVKFFLRAFIAAADIALKRTEAMLDLRQNSIAAIKEQGGKDTPHLMNAYTTIETQVFVTTTALAEAAGVSYNTAVRLTTKLVDMKILKLLKNQTRNRVYFYDDWLSATGINI